MKEALLVGEARGVHLLRRVTGWGRTQSNLWAAGSLHYHRRPRPMSLCMKEMTLMPDARRPHETIVRGRLGVAAGQKSQRQPKPCPQPPSLDSPTKGCPSSDHPVQP